MHNILHSKIKPNICIISKNGKEFRIAGDVTISPFYAMQDEIECRILLELEPDFKHEEIDESGLKIIIHNNNGKIFTFEDCKREFVKVDKITGAIGIEYKTTTPRPT